MPFKEHRPLRIDVLFEYTSDIPIKVLLVVKGFTLSIHYMDISLKHSMSSNIIYLLCNRSEARLEQSAHSKMRARPHRQHLPMITNRRTDSGRGGNGGVGNVVMKASRSEAARAAVRADESNLPHARLQGQAPGGR